MNKLLFHFLLIVMAFHVSALSAADRATELKDEMWNSSDKDFKVIAIPQKWEGKSAVVIAQLHRFEYKKAVMANLLRINEYSHFRIKLIDKNAINKYAELSYLADQEGAYMGTGLKVFVGFKVIKPNGKEVIVDLANAVKMERDGYHGKIGYYKIAIPNLEPGDILDYYICEENVILKTSEIEFFDPVIYNLPQEYPIMKQKLQFKAQRKCYINLRSVNNAPQLKLVKDEENDEQYYSLEDSDREGIADIKWLYSNRELPTVKFRASYASRAGLAYFDALLGKPGEVKSKVTSQELVDLTASLMLVQYPTKDVSKYLKEKYKDVKDPFEISKAGYYFYRNAMLQESESASLTEGTVPTYPKVKFIDMFSTFLSSKKIAHDIVIAAPRNISSIDDVVIEQELEYLVRVKKGDQYLYFSPMDVYLTPGQINPRLEGTDAYAVDGLISPSSWTAKRITLPVSKTGDNVTESTLTVKISDFSLMNISAQHKHSGVNKVYSQHEFLDVYDAIDEDNSKFKPHVSFSGYLSSTKKKYVALKDAYMAKRDKERIETLKKSIGNDYDFKIKDASNFKIEQTGRYNSSDPFVYTFDFTTEELIKKTGPNYLVDVGKLIEQQVKIQGDELERDYSVYFDNPRSFRYKIVFEIPKGYQVQGLDKFNQKVEGKAGGFVSSAKEEAGKVIIETYKHYDIYQAPKDQWRSIVDFLNAANTFSDQKILLKKVN
jgi:hypothetical protein